MVWTLLKLLLLSQISTTASVNSTIVLDPSTATGTITYKTSTDVDTAIKITLMDTITGTEEPNMAIPAKITEVPRVIKLLSFNRTFNCFWKIWICSI